MADLQIILDFLAAEANPIIFSAKVRDFLTLSSESGMLHWHFYEKM